MEVAGYPHYENVCSNLLAFYLDPNAEHEMGTLVLESLLDLAPDQTQPVELNQITIEREYSTAKNQRIDLVLEGSSHVISIENKVYHWLANDLAHYAETVESIAAPNRQTINFAHFVVEINGQSAEPKFMDGDRWIIQAVESGMPKAGKPYIVSDGSGSYLKKWNQKKKVFESINPKFSDVIPGEEAKLQGYPVENRHEYSRMGRRGASRSRFLGRRSPRSTLEVGRGQLS